MLSITASLRSACRKLMLGNLSELDLRNALRSSLPDRRYSFPDILLNALPTEVDIPADSSSQTISMKPAKVMADLGSMLSGSRFTFLVGPEKKAFTLHNEVVQAISESLDAMMNNGMMKESAEEFVTLRDIDPEVFARFGEFAYSGWYRMPPRTGDNKKGGEEVESREKAENDDGKTFAWDDEISERYYRPLSPRCTKCGEKYAPPNEYFPCCSKKCTAWPHFRDNRYCVTGCENYPVNGTGCCNWSASRHKVNHNLHWDGFIQMEHCAAGRSHSEVREFLTAVNPEEQPSDELICHAQLYVFADRYLIQPLKDLCLHRLHRDLVAYSLRRESISDLIDLIRYTYENTSAQSWEDWNMHVTFINPVELRSLVQLYAFSRAGVLSRHEEFRKMLRSNADFLRDFLTAITQDPGETPRCYHDH